MRTLVFTVMNMVISIIDIRTLRIPDRLLVWLLLVLLVFDRGVHPGTLLDQGIAGITGLLLFAAIYYFTGGIGFGDVKYAGIIGYALGTTKTCGALFLASLGGLIVFGIGILRRWQCNTRLPFAPFLAAAAILVELYRLPFGG
jgi:prepilin signal peptidase PulO-like enzyme (type II secretory pathway)